MRKRIPDVVFILTSGRSGSTLLRVMLAGHSKLFSPPELNLLPFTTLLQFSETLGPCPTRECGCDFRGGLQRAVMEAKKCSEKESRCLLERWVCEDRSIPEVFRYLIEAVHPKILVDKSPMYTLKLATLRRAETLFEYPAYIYLVRHPAAAIRSRVELETQLPVQFLGVTATKASRLSTFELAERFWCLMNTNVVAFLGSIPQERKCLVTFEELITHPNKTLTRICKLIGVRFQNSLLQPYAGNRMRDGARPGTMAAGGPKFHTFAKIDPNQARVSRSDKNHLRDETREIAKALGYT